MPYSLPHLLGCALGALIAGISIALIASPPRAPHDTFVETTSLASMGIGASKFEEVVQELAGAQGLQYDELQYDQDASGTYDQDASGTGKATSPPIALRSTRAPTPSTPTPTRATKPPTLAPAVAVSTYDDTDVQTNVSTTATAQLTAWKANETNEKTAVDAARATYAHASGMCACGACLSLCPRACCDARFLCGVH
jgi:hypothetical protein